MEPSCALLRRNSEFEEVVREAGGELNERFPESVTWSRNISGENEGSAKNHSVPGAVVDKDV